MFLIGRAFFGNGCNCASYKDIYQIKLIIVVIRCLIKSFLIERAPTQVRTYSSWRSHDNVRSYKLRHRTDTIFAARTGNIINPRLTRALLGTVGRSVKEERRIKWQAGRDRGPRNANRRAMIIARIRRRILAGRPHFVRPPPSPP